LAKLVKIRFVLVANPIPTVRKVREPVSSQPVGILKNQGDRNLVFAVTLPGREDILLRLRLATTVIAPPRANLVVINLTPGGQKAVFVPLLLSRVAFVLVPDGQKAASVPLLLSRVAFVLVPGGQKAAFVPPLLSRVAFVLVPGGQKAAFVPLLLCRVAFALVPDGQKAVFVPLLPGRVAFALVPGSQKAVFVPLLPGQVAFALVPDGLKAVFVPLFPGRVAFALVPGSQKAVFALPLPDLVAFAQAPDALKAASNQTMLLARTEVFAPHPAQEGFDPIPADQRAGSVLLPPDLEHAQVMLDALKVASANRLRGLATEPIQGAQRAAFVIMLPVQMDTNRTLVPVLLPVIMIVDQQHVPEAAQDAQQEDIAALRPVLLLDLPVNPENPPAAIDLRLDVRQESVPAQALVGSWAA
jgi:hypothetical protein